MPLIECLTPGCTKPKHNQSNKICKYCLQCANNSDKRYRAKNPEKVKKTRLAWQKKFKKDNGISDAKYYYNRRSDKSDRMIARHTDKKITDLCRIVDDQKDIIADLRKRLDSYRNCDGELK